MAPWNSKRLVGLTPVLTSLLLEGANLQQIWRMWQAHSALGQSVWGWFQVHLALWLWWNFYRVMTPDQKVARRATELSIVMNLLVILTVVYFHGR